MLLEHVFTTSARTSLLSVLFRLNAPIGLRRLVEISGVALRSAQLALEQLEEEHLVISMKCANRREFAVNREHSIHSMLKAVFDIERADRLHRRTDSYQAKAQSVLKFANDAVKLFSKTKKKR